MNSLKVQSGDTCSRVSVQFGITLSDFYFLNPQINSDCTNLWLNTAYCVQAVGTITTYPGYPTTTITDRPYTLTSETFITETWATVPSPTPTADPPVFTTAPGTWTNCSYYIDAPPKGNLTDQRYSSNDRNNVIPNEYYYCNYTVNAWRVSMDSFLNWNPSLATGNAGGNCTLVPSYRYCALVGNRK
jgi:LysM domain-containing protein